MGAIANLSASLKWDLDDFQRGTATIEGAFKGIIGIAGDMATAVANAGKRMTVGLTLPLAGLAALTTKAVATANELQSAFNYTFGAMAGTMNKWAEKTGDAMGRATQSMQQSALKFGQLFKAAAPTEAAAARLSQRFTELAQDASSFFDTDFDTAMGKIRSGLSGESEPLRDFGVFLTEAAVKAKALEMGLIMSGEELNEHGKIMARAALISEGLADAQGDIDRTSNSLSNRIRKITDDIREMAIEIGERLEPYAQKLASVVEALVDRFRSLPEGVKDAIVGFGAFLAILGPISIALSALAVTVLPLVLVGMGPLFAAISAIINPIGTLVVIAGKLVAEFGGIGMVFGKLAPLLLRFLGPVGLVIAALQLFGDDILRGLRAFAGFVSSAIGDGMAKLFASLGETVERVREAFDNFMASPLGEFLSDVAEWVGIALEAFITLAGYLTGQFITAVFEVLTLIVDFLGGVVETAVKLLTGDWVGAWDAAVQTVGRAIIRIGQWIGQLWPWLGGMIEMLGRLTGAEIAAPKAPGTAVGGAGGGSGGAGDMKGGDYAAPGKPKTPGRTRTTRARSGPTAEELAERREEIALQQQLTVAREQGDLDAIRALERKRDVLDRIERYERAGLKNADARIAAERDMAELDHARARAREEALFERQEETEYQVALLNNDFEHLRYLEAEQDLKRRINDLNREGYDLAQSEVIARAEMQNIEQARADAAARRLRDQKEAHEFELARMRGDSDESLRARDEAMRLRDRTDDLMDGGGMSRAEAEAQALREGADRAQAHIQGSFRDAFRNGLHAALNGDLGGFFEGWMRDRTFNALSKVLDRLADSLANLISGQNGGGGGGLGGFLGSVFGLATGNTKTKGASGTIVGTTTKKLAKGGAGIIQGHPGIDKNLLQLNGAPVAWVSQGETLSVQPNGSTGRAGGGGELSIRLGPGLEAEWLRKSAGQTVQIVQAAAPGMLNTASSKARRDAARPAMPGGATG